MQLSCLTGVLENCAVHVRASQADIVWLLGIRLEPTSAVIIGSVNGPDRAHGDRKLLQDDFDEVSGMVPVGVVILGIALRSAEDKAALSAEEEARSLLRSQQAQDEPMIVGLLEANDEFRFSPASKPSGSVLCVQQQSSVAQWLRDSFVLLRLQLSPSIQILSNSSQGNWAAACQEAFHKLEASLGLDHAVLLLKLDGSSEGYVTFEGDASSQFDASKFSLDQPAGVQVTISSQSESLAAPSVVYTPFKGGSKALQTATLHLDVLAYSSKTQPLDTRLAEQIKTALKRQLKAMQHKLVAEEGKACDLKSVHFSPTQLGYHLTVVKEAEDLDEDCAESMEQRRQLHKKFGLPVDRPLLRSANAVSFEQQPGTSGRTILQNVHEGVRPSGVKGGKVHAVWGTYDYYHYMQGKMDDRGWGCAYRSLQTVASWFKHQHFTRKPIPTHKEIQQTLVDIGDKDRSFVGSKQWIGAIEISFVLETLLGLTSKVITVSSGAEMDLRAREIAHHFHTQGTPIMIGGGVLAYTLLGIHYDELSGECEYLILDPHYTGSDDLKKIHSGQWVAWKSQSANASAGGKLFVPDAFYNLLCPQRPDII